MAMLPVSLAFARCLGRAAGFHPVILILGTSPKGDTEMAITTKVLQPGVPVVAAVQVLRPLAV